MGATNRFSPSDSPQTGLLYIATAEECDVFTGAPQKYHEGRDFIGSVYVPASGEKTWGALRAFDPFTSEKSGSSNTSRRPMEALFQPRAE